MKNSFMKLLLIAGLVFAKHQIQSNPTYMGKIVEATLKTEKRRTEKNSKVFPTTIQKEISTLKNSKTPPCIKNFNINTKALIYEALIVDLVFDEQNTTDSFCTCVDIIGYFLEIANLKDTSFNIFLQELEKVKNETNVMFKICPALTKQKKAIEEFIKTPNPKPGNAIERKIAERVKQNIEAALKLKGSKLHLYNILTAKASLNTKK